MKGHVIWRGTPQTFQGIYRVVLVISEASMASKCVVEEMRSDAAGGESWIETPSITYDTRNAVIDQAIHDLVATLQQQAQKQSELHQRAAEAAKSVEALQDPRPIKETKKR